MSKPISKETLSDVNEFLKDYDEQYEEIGEDIFTETAFLDDAVNLLTRIQKEVL